MSTEKLSNEAQTPALNKGAVSGCYDLMQPLNGNMGKFHICGAHDFDPICGAKLGTGFEKVGGSVNSINGKYLIYNEVYCNGTSNYLLQQICNRCLSALNNRKRSGGMSGSFLTQKIKKCT